MQSVLSYFRTPADPSQTCRFFRVRSFCRSPCLTHHPAYFGSATIIEANPFRHRLRNRNLGYAPTVCSCEEAHDPETCTVTTPDAAATFVASDLNHPSQDWSIFSGPLVLKVAFPDVPPSVFRTDQLLTRQPFPPST